MERSGGRSPEERRAAAEARAREREQREDLGEERPQRTPSEEQRIDEEISRRSPEGRPMSRHYGGEDVYGRRRLFAAAAVVGLVFVLFLLLYGC
jgi:hypothetical protein